MIRLDSRAASAVIATSSSVVHGIVMMAIGLDVPIGEPVSFEGVSVGAFGPGIPVAGQLNSCVPRAGAGCSSAAA